MSRGFLQFTITEGLGGLIRRFVASADVAHRLGFWTTAVIGSLLFGVAHGKNAGESVVGLVSAATIGLLLAFSLWRTGTLWFAIGFHAAWGLVRVIFVERTE